MNFLNPAAFLFLLTVPLLVLLYFLKLKRPRVRVASTLLWQKVIEDMRVNSPFQRLRRSLLLLLQLLLLLALILGLTRPLLRVRERRNESLIVILDTSASMMAVEPDGRTRLEQAESEILALIDHLSESDEMMVMTFASKAEVLRGFTSNKRQLRKAVAEIEPTHCSTDLEAALLLANSIANSRARARVLLFSDGAFSEPRGVQMAVEVEYRRIGTPRPNLAVTGLDIRRSIEDRDKIEMFVAVENFASNALAGTMTVGLNGEPLDSKVFSVGPEQTLSQIFEATLPAGGTIKVTFDVADALACDNSAWKVVEPPVRRRILLVGEEAFFIERVLKCSPGLEFRTARSFDATDSRNAGLHTVIWNGVAAPGIAPCHNLYLGCVPAVDGLTAGPALEAPDILDWDNVHPINRFLDFDNLIISTTVSLAFPPGGTPILRSSRTPLIGVLETGVGVLCVVGFDPVRSNWPLLVSFPLFLNNCLDYFEEVQGRVFATNLRVGRAITAPASSSAPTVVLPGGERRTMRETPGGGYTFADASHCGIYEVSLSEGERHHVVLNLFDRAESRLHVEETLSIGGKAVRATQQHKQIDREYWKVLVMGVGLLLVLEWAAYHRRVFA